MVYSMEKTLTVARLDEKPLILECYGQGANLPTAAQNDHSHTDS